MDADVIVVGAGLAGLRCAVAVKAAGLKPLVLEASDGVGGRVRTDRVDGFQLDRGFQVLLTAYPECQDIFDYTALDLGCFAPGAMIRKRGRFHRLRDPWRAPSAWLEGALSPIGSLADKLRLARLRLGLRRESVAESQAGPDIETRAYLQRYGFGSSMVEDFFRPFYGGIFLESELKTSARMFRFVFKMFSEGYAALPAAGMQALPEQLAAHLEPDELRLESPVGAVEAHRVELVDGERLAARAVVLATDMSAAEELSKNAVTDRGWEKTSCHYFSAPVSPLAGRLIALNATGEGVVSNVSIPSDIQTDYAPKGRSLVCVSTKLAVEAAPVMKELREWFGAEAESFVPLRSYTIQRALPRQSPGDLAFSQDAQPNAAGLWVCGDYMHSSSLEGALSTGRRTGQALAGALAV
jgi:phytoene dehydrogenase-like protein